MWCRNCNIETNEKNCPIGGQFPEEDTQVEIMWCGECNVQTIRSVNDAAREICPICGRKTRHLSADLRPVFPEERLLLELLLDKKPNEFAGKSVWASNSRYSVSYTHLILDENGRLVPRQDYRISSLNCGEEDFAVACMRANLRYGKNQQREDVKSHHYILSFDPRDGPDHGLTMDKAQALGERFCACLLYTS